MHEPLQQRRSVALNLEGLESRVLLSAPSVPFTDDFSDNAQGPVWALLEDAPADVWLAETQQRLEFRSDGSSAALEGAFYGSNGWTLDTAHDFAFKTDWSFTASGSGAALIDLTIVAAPPDGACSLGIMAGADGSTDFALVNGDKFGQPDVEEAVTRTSNQGTVYISYDAAADRASLSVNGYWRTTHDPDNGDWVYQGKVVGEWGAETVSVGIGGMAEAMAVGAGEAYADNFALDQGTVVTPTAQTAPLLQDFSSGRPDAAGGWGYFAYEAGRIQVTGGRLRMDDTVADTDYSLCEAVLHLDLSSATSATLTLDHWSLGDEDDPLPASFSGHVVGDGIAISADGVQWHTVTSLTGDFTEQSFDLDAVAYAAGISFSSDFQIKFQQYDNYPANSDGREFDNISVTAGGSLVWGLNELSGIFVREGITSTDPTGASWNRVPGKLAQVSAGEAVVWGVNSNGGVFLREGVSLSDPTGTSWTRVAGKLDQVSAGETGLLWGLNVNGGIFVREGVSELVPEGTGWGRVSGKLDYISVGEGSVWGLNTNGGIFVREGVTSAVPAGTGWLRVPGQLAQVGVGEMGLVWGINSNNGIFVREGVSAGNLTGTGWTRVSGKLAQASCGFGDVWGLNLNGGIFCRTGVETATTPQGTGWERCPGDLALISVGLTDVQGPSSVSSAEQDGGWLAQPDAFYTADDPFAADWDEETQGTWQRSA
ncbi:MAG: tectonin domain-containing protein [Candidatus Brocadiia bacterium]